MGLDELLKGIQTIAVVDNQFGDTGKGKVVDFLANWADVVARGTGGSNAGHTVVVNGKKRVFHLIPVGIINDSLGKSTLLGNGMVISPEELCNELDYLDSEGLTYNHLMISQNAHVVMPYHVQRDKSSQQKAIGTTGRGIGPCYADKANRVGITIRDLFDRDVLSRKIEEVKLYYPEQQINEDEIIEKLQPYIRRIRPFVRDTVSALHSMINEGKKVLVEGAQGLFLSLEHGTYPFVTSSDCSINGTASGVGLSAKTIDLPLGVIKFPFMTRVGEGPFPTEIGRYGLRLEEELENHKIPYTRVNREIIYNPRDPVIVELLKSQNKQEMSIGLRLAAREFGATTGRPRRVGWTDAVMAKYAVKINGPHLVVTKPDSFANAGEFKIAYSYRDGGFLTEDYSSDIDFLSRVKPLNKTYKEYNSLEGIETFSDLPQSLKEAIKDFESFTEGKVRMISTGPERDETIVM